MADHQRVVVAHVKNGRGHVHVVFNRVQPVTLRAAKDSWSYRIHEQVARDLEQRFSLRPVTGVHTRPAGTPRPVALANHRDTQAAQRTGIPVQEVAAALRAAWADTGGGIAFDEAIRPSPSPSRVRRLAPPRQRPNPIATSRSPSTLPAA